MPMRVPKWCDGGQDLYEYAVGRRLQAPGLWLSTKYADS